MSGAAPWLRPDDPRAHGRTSLWLLPFGPDQVHKPPIAWGPAVNARWQRQQHPPADLGKEFRPAEADCRYREPL